MYVDKSRLGLAFVVVILKLELRSRLGIGICRVGDVTWALGFILEYQVCLKALCIG